LPIVRKVIDVGKTSKAVILPKSWLDYYQNEKGRTIEQVTIEVNEVLRIAPFLPKLAKEEIMDGLDVLKRDIDLRWREKKEDET